MGHVGVALAPADQASLEPEHPAGAPKPQNPSHIKIKILLIASEIEASIWNYIFELIFIIKMTTKSPKQPVINLEHVEDSFDDVSS